MTAVDGFIEELRVRLRSVLESFGSAITERAPGMRSRVELPPSRIYDLVALVTFSSNDDVSTELVVLSLELSDLADGTWAIDVTDRESLPLSDDPAVGDQVRMIGMRTVDTAIADVQAILEGWSDRIVRELSP